jgi:hypothetical protein
LILLLINITGEMSFKRSVPELTRVTRIEPIRNGRSSDKVSEFICDSFILGHFRLVYTIKVSVRNFALVKF